MWHRAMGHCAARLLHLLATGTAQVLHHTFCFKKEKKKKLKASLLLFFYIKSWSNERVGKGGKKTTQLEWKQNINIKLMCDFHSEESILCMIVWGFGGLTNKEKNFCLFSLMLMLVWYFH